MPDRTTFERRHGRLVDFGLIALLIIQIMVLIYLGLRPFVFSLDNQVSRPDQGPGLTFDAVGIAMSEGALRGREDFAQENLSLHLMIQPHDEPRTGLGTILSIQGANGSAPLIVAQWKKWLVVRVRDPDHRTLGFWEMDAEGFRKGTRYFVSITSSPEDGTAIYVDGRATGDTRGRRIVRNEQGFDGTLLLGTLGSGAAGWRGVLSGLALTQERFEPQAIADHYARVRAGGFAALVNLPGLVALYDFEAVEGATQGVRYRVENGLASSPLGALLVPEIFSPLHPEVFGVPQLRDMKADWFLNDLLRNIAGFVPLGFVAAFLLMRNRVGRGAWIAFQVTLFGLLLSFGIESVQIALPMRSSSLSDLTLNGIGAMIGAVTALAFRHSTIATRTR